VILKFGISNSEQGLIILRISYQDNDSLDLLRSNEIIIDSIFGHIYDIQAENNDSTLSSKLLNMDYEIRNWGGLPKYQFKYSFIEFNLNTLAGFYINDKGVTKTKGIGMDHEFYIYTTKGIDTINFRWDLLLTPMEGCCNDCLSFPYTYLECNKSELTEGTKTGAAIIRK